MGTVKNVMTPRRDGEAGMEYRDFLVIDSLSCEDARLYVGTDAELPANTRGAMLVWRDIGGNQHTDIITAARHSPSKGWNTSLDVAAVEFLRQHDVLVLGWNG